MLWSKRIDNKTWVEKKDDRDNGRQLEGWIKRRGRLHRFRVNYYGIMDRRKFSGVNLGEEPEECQEIWYCY